MKVKFFDKRIRAKFYASLSIVSVVVSIAFVFVEINEKYKENIGLALVVFLVVSYIVIWIYYNKFRSIRIKINNSLVEIKYGDIFSEQADLKVIAFNEYFDTIVDDKVIALKSLNGKFINKFFKNNAKKLDDIIASDPDLQKSIVEEGVNRSIGKKTKYKLGSICVVNDYLLTALSRFDDKNNAFLEMGDYINFLLNFWSEVDRVYAMKTVVLPVLGSGITRFRGYDNVTDQELIELIIWTFKISRIKFTYPSMVKIVVYDEKSNKINLLKLRDLEE